MAPRTRVPILLLTGFLGSGKTSLLARWLRDPAFAGAMVIVNELGEVGLDDRLIETSNDTPLLLDNGCACCEAGEDLSATLERLFFDRLHRQIPAFTWVLIETTGIADPAPILERLRHQGLVAERYELRGVVTTFDARLGPGQLASHPECRSQVEHADVVLLTKTDVAGPVEVAAARDSLRALRPHVRILASARSDVDAASLLAAIAQGEDPCAGHGHEHGHHHGHAQHDHAHDHEPGHLHGVHTEGLSSTFAPLADLDATGLRSALERIMTQHGGAILRLKGLVRLNDGRWSLVQATPGTLDITMPPLHGGAPERSGVTLITQGKPATDIAGELAQAAARALSEGSAP